MRRIKEPPPYAAEVRISERVTLRKGDRVRVSGGPVFRCANGSTIGMGHRGRFTFVGAYTSGLLLWSSREGCAVIPTAGVSKIELPGYVDRPYKVRKCRTR